MQWTYSNLQSWDDSVGDIPNVISLDISYKNLIELPQKIFKLTSLHEFNCSYNNVTTLPKEIGQFTSLHSFFYGSNELTTLPEEIGQLTSLRKFYCDHNKLTYMPWSVYHNNLQEIKEYFKAYELKLLCVKRILALLKIQRFISQIVIPKYYDIKGPINLSI